jgi:hypothetical protein
MSARTGLLIILAAVIPALAFAQVTATAVPVDPTQNPILVPHQVWSGKPITLKAITNSAGAGGTYSWDPGDGSGVIGPNTVTDPYNLGQSHTYTGSPGQSYTATITVTAGGKTASDKFYIKLQNPPPNLPVEVNYAIDEGLWALHVSQQRSNDGATGLPVGTWDNCGANPCSFGNPGITGANTNAFEVSGHHETTPPFPDPYQETVARGLKYLFSVLARYNATSSPSLPATITNPRGTFNPDADGNGLATAPNTGNQLYQTGMFMDAIVASNTPATMAKTGPYANTGTYQQVVQDMVDFYSWCQDPVTDQWGNVGGAWRYSCQQGPDNSVAQWGGIGIIAARRNFGATVPTAVLKYNGDWLTFSQNAAGYYGYTNNNGIGWGPFAETPSGMVQAAMGGIGRGDSRWDLAETYLRDNFDVPPSSGATLSIKGYLYGMFSFTKAMLEHSADGVGLVPSPIKFLQSLDNPAGFPQIDWYGAQAPPNGNDPTDGVARTLVGQQLADGSWFGPSYSSAQWPFTTAWAIIMLRSTVTQTVPVACATANPAQVANGGPVQLDGSCSFDPNPGRQIVLYQWDVSGTGGTNFTMTGVKVNIKVSGAVGSTFKVRLRVTDNSVPALTGDTIVNILISAPPNPPQANPGGPYNFCPNKDVNGKFIYAPFLLDGSHSTNPDDGKTDGTPGAPPSAIVAWDWDYTCANVFNSAHGAQIDATSAFVPLAGQTFNICLKVTNNDNLAFPSAGLAAGLSSVGSTPVFVHLATDVQCTHCVTNVVGKVKAGAPGVPASVQLYWSDTNTAQFPIDHYNVYRSVNANFIPFTQVAGFNGTYPPVKVPTALGSVLALIDQTVSKNTTYYYRVAPATTNDTETCMSPQTSQIKVVIGPR